MNTTVPALTPENFSPILAQVLEKVGAFPWDTCELAGKAGSDRTYFRVCKLDRSWIVSVSPHSEPDFHHFLRITQFYRLLQIPVPHIYAIDDDKRQVLIEDLGKTRLYDRVVESKTGSREGYLRAIDLLGDLQGNATNKAGECPDIATRVFGLNDLRWERDYFLKQMVEGQLGISLSDAQRKRLIDLCEPISQSVSTHPLRVMHRDYQSQNLMLQGSGLRVIDYQGSRMGSCFYDCASLLFDPYVNFDLAHIGELAEYFFYRVPTGLVSDESWTQLLYAATQRLMQALGAYGFLSRKKGLVQFSAYTYPARDKLRQVLIASGSHDLEELLNDLGVWDLKIQKEI